MRAYAFRPASSERHAFGVAFAAGKNIDDAQRRLTMQRVEFQGVEFDCIGTLDKYAADVRDATEQQGNVVSEVYQR